MADQTERIIIEIDGSGVKGEAQQVERAINTIGDAADKAGKKVDTAEKGLDDLGKSLKTVGAGANLSEKQMQSLQNRIGNTSAARAQSEALKQIASAANLSTRATEALGKRMGVAASEIDRITGASKRASAAVREIGASSDRSAASMAMMTNAASAFGVALSVAGLVQFGASVIKAGIAMDALQRSFIAITGSQTAAAQELKFLREEADRLGQSFFDLAPIYKSVSAAARGTALEGEAVRKVFSSITEASSALGMSTADTEGALLALGQMISKGTVQAEELRGQLGERLPGAFNIMARALGVTTAELGKMLEQGQVLADEALPKLAAEISKMYGRAAETAALESAQAAVNKLSEAWTSLKTNLFDSQAFVYATNFLRETVEEWDRILFSVSKTELAAQERSTAMLLKARKEQLANLKGYEGDFITDIFRAEDISSLEEEIADLTKKLGTVRGEIASLAPVSKDSFAVLGEGMNRAGERAGQYLKDLQAADQELKKLTATALDKLEAQYNALKGRVSDSAALDRWYLAERAKIEEAATKKQGSELKKQVAASKKSREDMIAGSKAAEQAIAEYWNNYEDARIKAISDSADETVKLRVDAEKEAADAAAAILEKQQADAQKVMDNIQDATADVFYDLFNNIEDGWESLWSSMKSWALRTLAELAARAATVQIVVPIMTSMTGTANATQAVTAMTGQGNGGIMDLLTNMPTGGSGSLLESLPGGRYVSDALAYQLPGTATALAGSFGGVGAAAGTYATGLGFSSGVVANGALDGISLGGASLSASAPAMTTGLSLGSAMGMGALGGMGYSLLGGQIGLPQNQYSGITSSLGGALGAWGGSALAGTAGAALGATAGSVVPVIGTAIGAIVGGLASSLFGGGKTNQHPSVMVYAQEHSWGDSSVSTVADDGMKKSKAQEFGAQIGAYIAATEQQVESTLSAFGGQYVEMLDDATIMFGRHVDGLWENWNFASDKDLDKLWEQAQADLKDKIYRAASGAFTAAGRDLAGDDSVTAALSMLAGSAKDSLAALVEEIRNGVESGNIEAYVAQLQALNQSVSQINAAWTTINAAADDLVKPPTAYESAVRQANAQFDEWVGTLSALGFAQGKIEEIEAKRAATLARLSAEMGPVYEAEQARAKAAAEAEQARAKAAAEAEALVETAKSNLLSAYRAEAAELEKTQQKWESFAESLRDWRQKVLTSADSPLSASARATLIAATYHDTLARAKLGDESAISALTATADDQLAVALATAATAEDYARTAMQTLAETRDVEDVATRQANIAAQQLDALTQQVSQLITINESVLSVKEAIAALGLAQSAAKSQASVATSSGSYSGGSGIPALDNSGFNTTAYLVNKTAQVNADAIGGRSNWTTEQVRQAMADIGLEPWEHYLQYGAAEGIRAYASGGYYPGGLALVGEEGPELVNFSSPGMVYDAAQTKRLLSGRGDDTAAEVRALREELRAIGRALAKNTADTAKLMQRWDGDGMPEVRVA